MCGTRCGCIVGGGNNNAPLKNVAQTIYRQEKGGLVSTPEARGRIWERVGGRTLDFFYYTTKDTTKDMQEARPRRFIERRI